MYEVLLVDDEAMLLRILSQVLEHAGFSVITADCAEAAKAVLAKHEPFDLVVTDLRMESPVAGFEVVRAAKTQSPRPLIVILTAFPVPASEWKAAGADLLYVKGLNTAQLPKELIKLLQTRTPGATGGNAG
jgi:CheY-like chemotaxis protein